MSFNNKKRKIESENRLFNEKWKELYFCITFNSSLLCLICNEILALTGKCLTVPLWDKQQVTILNPKFE